MRIFLCYPKDEKVLAEPIAFALRSRGFEVFLDEDDLPAGRDYNEQIERAVEFSEFFIFLISPSSIEQGRYTLTELEYARRKWRKADGHVLPVMVRPTDYADIPAFLRSVDVLEPMGNIAAEVASTVGAVFKPPNASVIVPVGLALGAMSGLLSGLLLIPVSQLDLFGTSLFLHTHQAQITTPFWFAAVLTFILWRWSRTSSLIRYGALFVAVLAGWLCAVNLAALFIPQYGHVPSTDALSSSEALELNTALKEREVFGWLAGSLMSGAVGALATMLGVGSVCRGILTFENVITAVFVGAVIGLLLYPSGNSDVLAIEVWGTDPPVSTWLLLTCWQSAIAGLIGYFMSRESS